MGEKLNNAPIVEALCEFIFDASEAWDWTIPGQMFEKIKSEFSERSQLQGVGFEIKLVPEGPQPPRLKTGPERVRLTRKDGSAMVQIGENLLAINQLRPYPNWENFRDLILRIYSEYAGIAPKVPLKRIGLRYINQIETPPSPLEIGDFITVDPPLKGPLDRTLTSFYQRYEILHDDLKGVLIHQTGIVKVQEQHLIMLDLDFGSEEVRTLGNKADIQKWLDEAHGCILEAFVASLNPSLYDRMKRGR